MKRYFALTALVLLVPSLATAHVGVRPRESKPGAEESYTIRVPTEGTVATTHVRLEIPPDVTVLEVLPAEGAAFDTATAGGRVTAITWKKEIAPKQAAEFVFRARNPSAGDIVWKAHQHFADGTAADWIGPAGDRRPAAVTKLVAASTSSGGQANDEARTIEAWLKGYDAAFNAKDLDKLATFYHPDATIYEGGGINNGWIDYRDGHLGPELKAFEDLQFGHRSLEVSVLPGGQSAYAKAEYFLKAKMGAREIDSTGLGTYVLIKGENGWKIRHSHTSSRPRRPAGG